MKKTLFTSILALCCASAAMATTYTTQNGAATTTNGGVYASITFVLDGTEASDYTTTTDDGTSVFEAASTVNLDSITIYSRVSCSANDTWDTMGNDSTGTAFTYDNLVLCITIDGTSYYSSTATVENGDTTVTGTLTSMENLASLTFEFEDVTISTATTYTAALYTYDSNTEAYTATSISLSASQYTSDDWSLTNLAGSVQGNSFGPTATTVVTSTYVAVPEPATATLSLVALAGLMVRRRRQA